MRKYVAILLILVLISVTGRSAIINNINIYANPTPGGQKTHIVYNITYQSNQSVISLITLYDIYDVNAYSHSRKLDCEVSKKEVGTLILCRNVNSDNVVISFYSDELVKIRNNIHSFGMNIPINDVVNNVHSKIELPSGFVIVDKKKLEPMNLKPYYPDDGNIGSTGRTIYVEWNMSRVELGSTLRFSVFYEPASQNSILIWAAVFLISIAMITLLLFFLKSKQTKTVLATMLPDERKVIEIILQKKNLYQKDIVKETNFSKAKVSRILKNFEERGLIKRERIGRRSKIKIIKFFR